MTATHEAALVPVTDPTITIINPAEDPAYEGQVVAVAEALHAATAEDLATTRGDLVRRNGGWDAAESLNFWEAVREAEAKVASRQISEAMQVTQEVWADNMTGDGDAADRIITAVARDVRGTTDPTRTARGDIVDFSVGSSLESMIDSGEIQDPAVLLKVTATARILVEQGLYKFMKWGSGDQLEQALATVERFAERVPAFDINLAGCDRARSALVRGSAALEADDRSKPNFQYAMPERGYLQPTAYGALKTLERIGAHRLLQEAPFDELMGTTETLEIEAGPTEGNGPAAEPTKPRHRK